MMVLISWFAKSSLPLYTSVNIRKERRNDATFQLTVGVSNIVPQQTAVSQNNNANQEKRKQWRILQRIDESQPSSFVRDEIERRKRQRRGGGGIAVSAQRQNDGAFEEAREVIEQLSSMEIEEQKERERERGRWKHVVHGAIAGEGTDGGNRDIQATGLVISYGSAVTTGAFPSVDPFALPILTSPKSCIRLLPGIRNNRNFTACSRERRIPRLRGNHDWSGVHTKLD